MHCIVKHMTKLPYKIRPSHEMLPNNIRHYIAPMGKVHQTQQQNTIFCLYCSVSIGQGQIVGSYHHQHLSTGMTLGKHYPPSCLGVSYIFFKNVWINRMHYGGTNRISHSLLPSNLISKVTLVGPLLQWWEVRGAEELRMQLEWSLSIDFHNGHFT